MKKILILSLLTLLTFSSTALAWYPRLKQEMVLSSETRIVGRDRAYIVGRDETLIELARRTGIGFENMLRANPGIDPWNPPPGARLTLPTAALLPRDIQDGITINLAELRLYLFWKEDGVRKVRIYPVGIGREGWATPLGEFHVKLMIDNPVWAPPTSLREEKPELPGLVSPGPDNPLGSHWIGLSAEGVGIHGTNQPLGVGRRVSHGCIRLYPEDILDLVAKVKAKTPVRIVDEPVKQVVRNGELYLEVHRQGEKLWDLGLQADRWDQALIARTLQEARGLPVKIPLAHDPLAKNMAP